MNERINKCLALRLSGRVCFFGWKPIQDICSLIFVGFALSFLYLPPGCFSLHSALNRPRALLLDLSLAPCDLPLNPLAMGGETQRLQATARGTAATGYVMSFRALPRHALRAPCTMPPWPLPGAVELGCSNSSSLDPERSFAPPAPAC